MKQFILVAFAALMVLSSCSSYTASGAMLGGAIGSAVGGITGGYRGHDMGALVGMAAGAVVGAAAEAQEKAAYERRMRAYDDVYYGDEGVYRDVAKAKRVQSYHNKVKYGKRSRRGYRNTNDNYTDDAYNSSSRATYGAPASTGSGFHLEAGKDPMAGAAGTTSVTPQQDVNNSGYSSDTKYDDRIEMK